VARRTTAAVRAAMALNDGMWRKVRGSNPQGLIQPRRFSRAVQSPICLTFHAASCGNDSRKLRKPQEISFVKQCCKATRAGFQVLRESAGDQGRPWFSFPQPCRICPATGQQPRRTPAELRKRFYANGIAPPHRIAHTTPARTSASTVATAAHRRTARAKATSRRSLSRQAAQRASRACCLASMAPMRRSVSSSTSV